MTATAAEAVATPLHPDPHRLHVRLPLYPPTTTIVVLAPSMPTTLPSVTTTTAAAASVPRVSLRSFSFQALFFVRLYASRSSRQGTSLCVFLSVDRKAPWTFYHGISPYTFVLVSYRCICEQPSHTCYKGYICTCIYRDVNTKINIHMSR